MSILKKQYYSRADVAYDIFKISCNEIKCDSTITRPVKKHIITLIYASENYKQFIKLPSQKDTGCLGDKVAEQKLAKSKILPSDVKRGGALSSN